MRNVIKKISISLLTLLIVFTSVSSYEYTRPQAQVQAEEFSLETMRSKLLAIILAAIGVSISTDVTANDMNKIYNNLSTTAKYVLDNFDYQNRFYSNYYALTLAEMQQITHSVINTIGAYTMAPDTTYYWSPENLLQETYYYSFGTPWSSTTQPSYMTTDSIIDQYQFSNVMVSAFTHTIANVKTLNNTLRSMTLYGRSFQNFTYLRTMFVYVPLSTFTSTPFYDSTLQKTIALTDKVLALKVFSNATNMTTATYNGYIKGGSYTSSTEPSRYVPYDLSIGFANQLEALSLYLTAGGLTLPAPLGGWDDSQAGDIDVPNDWSKWIATLAGLPLVVLGGLNAQDLNDLKNKGPQDVIVGDELPQAVEDVLGGSEVVDGGVDVIDPTFPDINIGDLVTDMTGWLSGAFGALTGAITGTIANLGNALTGLGNSIWTSIKDILALLGGLVGALTLAMTNTADYILTGLEALLATLAASLLLPFQGFSWPDLTANWDWLKTLLNFIKDFFVALWELIKFFLSLFQYLFTWFLALLNLLYESFFVGLATTLILLSNRVKSLLSVLPNPLDTIAGLTYDVVVFGLVLSIIRNVLFLLRGKK